MWIVKTYGQDNDPLGFMHLRYGRSHRFVEPISTAAILGASAIGAGGSIAGGLIGGKGGDSIKRISTFSRSQKIVDRLISDFMLGITRDAKGREISRDPIFQRMLADGKGLPPAFVRPHSDAQNKVFDIAEGMIGKTNRRPDLDFVADKRKEILGAALGGNFDDAVVVGEDGPEIVIPDGDGSITVIPNPDSVANPERAAAASRAVTRATGLPGKALGDLPFRRQFTGADGNNIIFNPENFSSGRNFGFDPNDATGQSLNNLFTKHLEDNFADASFTVGDERTRTSPDTVRNIKFLDKFRSDDGSINFEDVFKRNKDGSKFLNSRAAQFFTDAQDDFLGSDLFSDATSNPLVDEILGRVGTDNLEKFGGFLGDNSKFGFNTGNEFGLRGGEFQFDNPFDLDVGNLGVAADTFLAGIPASQGGTGEEPETPVETGTVIDDGMVKAMFDGKFEGVFDLTDADSLSELNGELADFYNTDTGRLFKNSGINIEVGLDGLITNGATGEKFNQFLNSFEAFRESDGDVPADTPTSDLFETLTPTITGLVGDGFDAEAAGQEFKEGVGDPSRDALQDTTLPSIREGFAGGNLFGSGRQKAEQRAITDLEDTLATAANQFVSGRKESFENRRVAHISQAMELMKLPTEIANMKASGRAIEATITRIFADIEIGQAALEANLTNQDLGNLVSVWSLLESKNLKLEQQDLADIKNAFTNDDGFSLTDILNIMNNKLNANESAIVTG